MNQEKNFLYCYSPNLFNFLRFKMGFEYICTGYHIQTKKQFWQFSRNESLLAAMDDYRKIVKKY